MSNNPLDDMKDDADFNHQEAELQLARESFKLAEEENERLRAEVARLRAEAGAINDTLGVIDASVAPAVIRELRDRVGELLTSNNRYLEDARAARRELRDAKAINALITRQLITLREALEFYADEKPYQGKGVVEGGGVVTGELPPIVEEGGAIAEQALQDVFGYQRPSDPPDPPDPYKHNPGARPMPHPGAK